MNGKRAMIAIGLSAIITAAAVAQAPARRVSATQKGSLLIYPKIELRWNETGDLIQDTFFTITNDYPAWVDVQLYFVNGDDATAAVFAGDPPQLIERGHPGHNWVDCQITLTPDQPTYMSAATGLPVGCQPWPSALDPGDPPGRPDPDNPGGRILRGFVFAFAIDGMNGLEIQHNHLQGSTLIVNYATTSAWETNAYAFQRMTTETGDSVLRICEEYECGFDMLLLDFYASGSLALSGGGRIVQIDTDLTLMPISHDLRQDNCGPVVTKAKFDIWNMNETRFSGTERCITCWNQTLLSRYVRLANHFLRENLQTDKGKARIDGVGSTVCDPDMYCGECDPHAPECCSYQLAGCSRDVSLLGVASKLMVFTGVGTLGVGQSGVNLVGMGTESGAIKYDPVGAPPPLRVPTTPEISTSEVDSVVPSDAIRTSRKATRR